MVDPITQFHEWMAEARRAGTPDATAMALATVDSRNRPSVRMVLLKAADARGFVFYTNLESKKADDLKHNPAASLCFYWPLSERQVRVEGNVEPVTDAEADAYWATRPRLSQLGGWASKQSRPMQDRFGLQKAVAAAALRFPFGDIPRPPFWSGYRLVAERIEFWHQKPFRHHDRTVFTKQGDGWSEEWLFP
jgi:pyridoxamine 5'-phosphate oxidase